jgi:hypothetical protein
MPDALPQPAPEMVPMIDDQGQPAHVPADQVAGYTRQGYKPSTEAQNAHLKALSEAGEHPIEAGALGAARGLIPGAPSIVQGLGGPDLERQRLLKEANPTASTVGEIGGNVAQAVGVGALTGGLGDVAEGASGVLDAADMAKQAAMFGAQGAQNEINEEDLGDHGYNSEAIISQTGLGAILGAASSPVFGLAKEILPNPITLAGKAISKASDAIGAAMGKGAALTRPGIPGIEEASRNIFNEGVNGTPEAERVLENQGATNLKQNFEKLGDAVDNQVSHAYETLRPAQIDAMAAQDVAMNNHSLEKTVKGLESFRTNAIDPTLSKLTALADEGKVSKNLVGHLETAAKTFSEDLGDVSSVKDGVMAGHRLGRYLDDNVMKYAKDLSPEVHNVVGEIEQKIRTPLRQVMRDPEIMGANVAEANGKLTDLVHAVYQSQGALYRKMGITNLLADGRPADMRELSESKFLTHIRGEDKLSQSNNRDILDRVVQDAKNLNEYTAQMAREGNLSTNSNEIENLIKSSAEARVKASAASSLNSGFGYSVGGFGPEAVAAGLGHMTGIPGAGPVAGAITRGVRAVYHPAGALQTLGRIKGLADKHTAMIAKAASNFFTDSGKLVAPAVASNALRAGKDSEDHGSETAQRMAEVENLASNQQLRENALIKNTSGLMDGAPNHGIAVQMNARARLGVISSALPPKPPPSMIQAKQPRSIDADQHFDRVLQIANHPVKSVTALMGDGMLTPEAVATADACAPQSMARLRSAFQAEMVDRHDHDYSLSEAQMLSTLFKVPVRSDLQPQNLAFTQATFGQPQSPASAGGPQGKPRAQGLDKLTVAKNTATPSQANQMEG